MCDLRQVSVLCAQFTCKMWLKLIISCSAVLNHSVMFQLFVTQWTVVHQVSLSTGFLQGEDGVLQANWPGLIRPWSFRICVTGEGWQRGYCFLLGRVCLGFRWTITGLALVAGPTCPWAQISGFTPGRSTYFVWGSLSSVINMFISWKFLIDFASNKATGDR